MNIVHIGYPKTATTFLQWEVFPNLEGVNYVDYNTCRKIFPPIIYRDIIDYNVREISNTISSTLVAKTNNLFSFEALCGQPYGGAKGMNRSLIAQSLKNVGFDKVIITVRNPFEALDSYYRQYVIHGGTLRFKEFVDFENTRNWALKHFNLSYLRYEGLIKKYEGLFGKENVLVISQEGLKKHFDVEISRIEQFTISKFNRDGFSEKRKVNHSLSNLSINLLRFFNFFSYNTIRPSHLISNHFSTRNFWLLLKLVLDPYLFKLVSGRKSFLQKHQLEDQMVEYYDSTIEFMKEYKIDYSRKSKKK